MVGAVEVRGKGRAESFRGTGGTVKAIAASAVVAFPALVPRACLHRMGTLAAI